MKLEFLFLGKTRTPYLARGIEDFAGRLKHYARIDVKILREVKMLKTVNDSQVVEAEADILRAAVTKNALTVALDPGGRLFSSEELANQFTAWENRGSGTISFLIGGPLGLESSLVRQADLALSFSPMTFPHEIARLLLMEQIYRAYTIKAGEKYHK